MSDLGVMEIRVGAESIRIIPDHKGEVRLASRLATSAMKLGRGESDGHTEMQLLKARVACLEQQLRDERG